MLSLDDADELLTGTAIRTPAIRVAQDGSVLGETAYVRQGASIAGRPLSGLVDPRKALDLFARRRDHRLPGVAPLPPAADRPGRAAGARARAPLPGQRLPHAARLARLRGAQRQPRRVRLPDPRHQAVGGAPPPRRAALRPRGTRGRLPRRRRAAPAGPLHVPADRHPARRPRAGRRQPPRDHRHQPAHVARPGAADRRPAPRRGRRAAPARRLGRSRRRAGPRSRRPAPGPGSRAGRRRPHRGRRPRDRNAS